MTAPPAATIDYIELPAIDIDETKRFYTAAFGWAWVDYGLTYAARDGDGVGDGVGGAVEVALNTLATAAPRHAPGEENGIGPLVLFSTADLEAVESAVRAADGEIISAIYRYPGGRRFHFADPSGNVLGVYQSDAADGSED